MKLSPLTILNIFLLWGIVAVTVVLIGQGNPLFNERNEAFSSLSSSMIPGAEAVRPVAANQSGKASKILSELIDPQGMKSSEEIKPLVPTGHPNLQGLVREETGNPFAQSWTVLKNAQPVLNRTDFRDPENGTLVLRTWERYQNGNLRRKVDEHFAAHEKPIKRYRSLFAQDGTLLSKNVTHFTAS